MAMAEKVLARASSRTSVAPGEYLTARAGSTYVGSLMSSCGRFSLSSATRDKFSLQDSPERVNDAGNPTEET